MCLNVCVCVCVCVFERVVNFFFLLKQVFQPWIQKRRLAYAKHKHVISGFLRHAQMEALGRLLTSDGEPNVPVIKK